MKEVKRYDGKVGHSPDGGYVSYEDYAALQQKLIALGKELGVIKQFKVAYEWWQEKTDWVQKDKRFDVLAPWGKHRADVMREYIEHLEQQLTATTNSLTNAQEALKSAGIEADTVQAGVMELKAQRDALAAENAILKSGIGFFSYGSDSGFEEHESAEKAIEAADCDIDYYRGDACDGWSEETDQTVWGVIMQRATMVNEQPRTEELPYGSCDYALLPNLATPATDACLNAVRADVLLQFFNEQMEWALVNWQWSNFTSLERAAIREGDCELSGVILMLKKIADFENELRAGNAGKDGV